MYQRTMRWPAHGLHELMTYFFRNEVKLRLSGIAGRAPPLPWHGLDEALRKESPIIFA
jgi:hypothetical protein